MELNLLLDLGRRIARSPKCKRDRTFRIFSPTAYELNRWLFDLHVRYDAIARHIANTINHLNHCRKENKQNIYSPSHVSWVHTAHTNTKHYWILYCLTLLVRRGKLPEDCSLAPMQLTIALIHRQIISGPLCLLLWLISANREFRRSKWMQRKKFSLSNCYMIILKSSLL